MPGLARSLNGSLFVLLRADADHVLFSVRHGDDLLEVEEERVAHREGRDAEALSGYAVAQKPNGGRGHLFAEVRGDHDDALRIARVEHQLVDVVGVEELADERRRVRLIAAVVAVEVGLKTSTIWARWRRKRRT